MSHCVWNLIFKSTYFLKCLNLWIKATCIFRAHASKQNICYLTNVPFILPPYIRTYKTPSQYILHNVFDAYHYGQCIKCQLDWLGLGRCRGHLPEWSCAALPPWSDQLQTTDPFCELKMIKSKIICTHTARPLPYKYTFRQSWFVCDTFMSRESSRANKHTTHTIHVCTCKAGYHVLISAAKISRLCIWCSWFCTVWNNNSWQWPFYQPNVTFGRVNSDMVGQTYCTFPMGSHK